MNRRPTGLPSCRGGVQGAHADAVQAVRLCCAGWNGMSEIGRESVIPHSGRVCDLDLGGGGGGRGSADGGHTLRRDEDAAGAAPDAAARVPVAVATLLVFLLLHETVRDGAADPSRDVRAHSARPDSAAEVRDRRAHGGGAGGAGAVPEESRDGAQLAPDQHQPVRSAGQLSCSTTCS